MSKSKKICASNLMEEDEAEETRMKQKKRE